ncbi:MAG TPA: DUF1287 domain-containing protein [Holophagaceae bacterium]|nr:DUF1287 domain-containing protein [Holophagaceae bacterium]
MFLIPLLLAIPALGQPQDPALLLVQAARVQVGVTLHYDSRYARMVYPGGDVPLDRGVCTDVLIRAYRHLGIDLQRLVHEDMLAARDAYPRAWHMNGLDTNIDHRRVPNLAVFFARHGQTLSLAKDASLYRPGDLVLWCLPRGLPHIGIVSDRRTREGRPLVIHNVGYGTREEDVLFAWTLTGHFRYFPERSGL